MIAPYPRPGQRPRRQGVCRAAALAGLAILACAGTEAIAATGARATDPVLQAGAGKAAIAITPQMLPLDGFKVVHDPLMARVVLLREGADRAAIAVVDQTSMAGDLVDAVKAVVARDTATPVADILVVASHTFSAPHLFSAAHMPPGMTIPPDEAKRVDAYRAAVLAAVEEAARQATATAGPTTADWAVGTSDVNVNRNVPAADGWWLGANPAGPSDKDLAILRLSALDGRTAALLVDYAVQSSVMDHSVGSAGRGITPDLGGTAVRHIEQQYGPGAVALFLTGAAGDQAPAYTARQNRYDRDGRFETVDIGDKGYDLVAAQGGRLSEDATRAIRAAAPVPKLAPLAVRNGSVALEAQERPTDLAAIRPTRRYDFRRGGRVDAPFVVLRIGEIAIVGVQAELSAVTGRAIRARSPFAHTMVVTMVNGAAKYMPERESYANVTYEAMNSGFVQGSAERFADAIVATLRAMHGGSGGDRR